MNVKLVPRDRGVVVEVRGRVTIGSAPDLHDKLKQAIAQDKAGDPIIVCLYSVDYMDSSGVGVLVSAYKQATAKNIKLALANVSDKVRSVLELTRLTQLFPIFEGVSVAIQELAEA